MNNDFSEASRFDVLADTIRVLVADDHRTVREGLRRILDDAPDVSVVAEAQSGDDVLAQVQALGGADGLELVLLDPAMPGLGGLDVLQRLRKQHPRLPVLMLSADPDREHALSFIRLGASGCLNKDADPDDMLLAVRKCAGGGRYLTPATAQALALAAGSGAGPAGAVALSHREQAVYRLLVQGLTVSEMAARLGLPAADVSSCRARILEKTGARNEDELRQRAGTDRPLR